VQGEEDDDDDVLPLRLVSNVTTSFERSGGEP
jgi:hypothetical protein